MHPHITKSRDLDYTLPHFPTRPNLLYPAMYGASYPPTSTCISHLFPMHMHRSNHITLSRTRDRIKEIYVVIHPARLLRRPRPRCSRASIWLRSASALVESASSLHMTSQYARDQVIPILPLLQAAKGHLGARDVLLRVLEVLELWRLVN